MEKKAKMCVISGDNLGYLDNRKYSLGILSYNDIKAGNNDGSHDKENLECMKKAIDSLSDVLGKCASEYDLEKYRGSKPDETGFDLMDSLNVPAPRILINYPENGLSAQRQLRMTDRLVSIAKEGISVVVITNSPYIVQGVRYYADVLLAETDYYLCERDGNEYKTENVTDSPDKIFIPMMAILNEVMEFELETINIKEED